MLFDILLRIIFPVFLLIAVGVLLDRKFKLDVPTLSKLNFYVFVPSLIFLKLVETDLDGSSILYIMAFVLIQLILLFLLAFTLFSNKTFIKKRVVLTLSSTLNNCGYYGIPFIILAFGNLGVNIIAVVIIVQNILTFTIGAWLFKNEDKTNVVRFQDFFKVPVLWAVLLGWGFHLVGMSLPEPLRVPLVHLANGIVPIALITLGIQLSRSSIFGHLIPVSIVTVLKLIVSPLLAFLLLQFFHFPELTWKILLVAAGFPSAINVFILAAEHDKDTVLASQTVFWTTLTSAISMTVLLSFFR